MQGAYPGYGTPSAPPPPTKHKEMLFEIKGYPHFLSEEDPEDYDPTARRDSPSRIRSTGSYVQSYLSGTGYEGFPSGSNQQLLPSAKPPGESCKCFFATAKPYPSRNAAM
jgi:hypothetical protein